ncbi:MAG TPA: 5-formyltetrahydrofolate cyclo-ligase [Acidimicrobiia bacterium]|nr:5-formyltetrahydrofolate cyclo-ligase [Acidimicrobiia bacterium]
MTRPGPEAGKAEWRAWAKTRLSSLDLKRASGQILESLRSWERMGPKTSVLFYDPLPNEPDVSPLAEEVRAWLTRLSADGGITVHPYDSPREEHRYGFTQPIPEAPTADAAFVDVVLVPGLAFDRTGARLGRGGGHYDRFLGLLRGDALVVGVIPSGLVVDRLPREAHDLLMTHLVTEEGVAQVAGVDAAPDLTAAARAWITGDPDPVTRTELADVVMSGDVAALEDRMGEILHFGTAGIRGKVGAGSNRMNRAMVIKATRGIADHLVASGRGDQAVVVGFDGRPDSRRFAEDAVGVLMGAGIAVRFFPDVTPTPLVAFTLKRLGATAAVVVTASHNPPRDNGYKVYDANGAQIVPPADSEIAAAIDRIGPAVKVPRVLKALDGPGAIGRDAEDAYVAAVLGFRGEAPGGAPIDIVYTPLHGVGGRPAVRLLGAAGYDRVTPVPEQFEPDGTFPTVAFPNPEEPGALDLAMALATESGADLVLANDPDVDRMAACVPDANGWRRLSGNEIGVLLGDFVLERTSGADRLVVSSIVSSPMLGAVAAHHGVRWESTLTGFKWICNAALDLERRGLRFVYGFEEALGYSVGPVVRDKDGMSAAVWFADLASTAAAAGEPVLDRLARLYVRDGLWVSKLLSLVRPGRQGLDDIATAMDRLRAAVPDRLGGFAVTGVVDYRDGAADRPRWLAATPLVAFSLEGGSRVLVRPSGTEPKLKVYADVRAEVDSPAEVPAASARAREAAAAVGSDLVAFLGLPG